MRIDLMRHPWASRAAHALTADSISEWTAAVAQIPPGRYSAAVWLDNSGKPYPVQWFNGALWPRSVLSEDGFVVVRTGLSGAAQAADQWACITDFPARFVVVQRWIGAIAGDFVRQAVFPPPKLIRAELPPPFIPVTGEHR